MRAQTRRFAVVTALAVVLCAAATEAQAAFPGHNGKLVFVDDRDGNAEIYTANPDGSDVTRLTFTSAAAESGPHWSPDGQRIAFLRRGASVHDIYLIDPQGGNETATGFCQTVPDCAIGQPAWSPDGTHLTWGADQHCGWGGLWIANADGTEPRWADCAGDRGFSYAAWSPDGDWIAYSANLDAHYIVSVTPDGALDQGQPPSDRQMIVPLENRVDNLDADWSPNGARVAYYRSELWGDIRDVYTVNPDGTGRTLVRSGAWSPVWSPDASRIAFVDLATGEIRTMDPDGSDESVVTTGVTPDWQPIPVNSYVRPKGAARQRIALVTAYEPCTAPDRVHGPPLAFGSCSAPRMTSDEITVGTGDSNGLPARNRGYLNMSVIVGDPHVSGNDADLRVELFLDGLYDKSTLEPYPGEVQARFEVQITDRENTPHPGGPGPGTTVTIPFEMTAPTCVPSPPPDGTACVMVSELSALIPGAVKEGGRAIWEVDDVEVWDGGPDGDADTEPNTLFARQGVFVP